MGIFLVINVYISVIGIFYDKDVRDDRGIGCSGY